MAIDGTETFELRGSIEDVERAFARIDTFCEAHPGVEAIKYRLFLVCEELMTNAIRHGYADKADGAIWISLTLLDDEVELVFQDEAPPFDVLAESTEPDLEADVDNRRIGGLGVHMVKTLCRRAHYRREGARNIVEAHIGLDPDDLAPAS